MKKASIPPATILAPPSMLVAASASTVASASTSASSPSTRSSTRPRCSANERPSSSVNLLRGHGTDTESQPCCGDHDSGTTTTHLANLTFHLQPSSPPLPTPRSPRTLSRIRRAAIPLASSSPFRRAKNMRRHLNRWYPTTTPRQWDATCSRATGRRERTCDSRGGALDVGSDRSRSRASFDV